MTYKPTAVLNAAPLCIKKINTCCYEEKNKEIWLRPMTEVLILTENKKKTIDNTKTPPKIVDRLRTVGWSITTAIPTFVVKPV